MKDIYTNRILSSSIVSKNTISSLENSNEFIILKTSDKSNYMPILIYNRLTDLKNEIPVIGEHEKYFTILPKIAKIPTDNSYKFSTGYQLLKGLSYRINHDELKQISLNSNDVYYGNPNILIDSSNNVLFLVCVNIHNHKVCVLISEKAVFDYGPISKEILGTLIPSCSVEASGGISYIKNNSVQRKLLSKDNIIITKTSFLNSFIEDYSNLSSDRPSSETDEVIKQFIHFNKEKITDSFINSLPI